MEIRGHWKRSYSSLRFQTDLSSHRWTIFSQTELSTHRLDLLTDWTISSTVLTDSHRLDNLLTGGLSSHRLDYVLTALTLYSKTGQSFHRLDCLTYRLDYLPPDWMMNYSQTGLSTQILGLVSLQLMFYHVLFPSWNFKDNVGHYIQWTGAICLLAFSISQPLDR